MIDQKVSVASAESTESAVNVTPAAVESVSGREGKNLSPTINVPDIDWVTVSAGDFIYGDDSEQTSHYLQAFEISRYPVTNTQYQCFVDDDGYENEQWWQALEKPEIKASHWPQGNRPRTDVDWYEATAFTCWLSDRLNETIRLPNEHEWEKAARGENGFEYPWGEDYEAGNANVDESGIEGGAYLQQAVAVGLYPRNESPWGSRDMTGNVWEWCNEIANDDKESTQNTSPSPVLRGGAWNGAPVGARAARRNWYGNPDFRDLSIGFRLLRSPPS
jgi:formylglycine-generating enzyme required for sulfatase activity